MKIDNAYEAVATEVFFMNDPVIIVEGKCMRAKPDSVEIFHVIDSCVNKGDLTQLAGRDTVFHFPEYMAPPPLYLEETNEAS